MKNINLRLRQLRDDLPSLPEPGAILRKLFQDLYKLGPLHPAALYGTFENEFARLDSKEVEPMRWLTQVFPEISEILTARQYTEVYSSVDCLFDRLHQQSNPGDLDLLACIASIDNPETKAEFQSLLISRLIVSAGDTRQERMERMERLPPSVRAEAEQSTMQLAARHKAHRARAFEMNLPGGGVSRVRQDLLKSCFALPDWFWPKIKRIAQKTATAPRGQRRDEVIASMMRLTGNCASVTIGQWPIIDG